MHAVAKVGDTVIAETDTYEVVEGVMTNSLLLIWTYAHRVIIEHLFSSKFYREEVFQRDGSYDPLPVER